jgi:hypothetical protein
MDNLNKRQIRLIAVVLVIHTLLLALTRQDLRSRPEIAVRGPKRLWRVWATLNTTGSVAYWLVGRKRVVENGVEVASA